MVMIVVAYINHSLHHTEARQDRKYIRDLAITSILKIEVAYTSSRPPVGSSAMHKIKKNSHDIILVGFYCLTHSPLIPIKI